MWTSKLKLNVDLCAQSFVSSRQLRSARITKEREKRIDEQQKLIAQAAKVEEDKQQELWRQEDEDKLLKWTPWRRSQEDIAAKKHLPLPMSLTGFGDGAKPRYWSYKIKRFLQDWLTLQERESIPWHKEIPASVRHVLSTDCSLLDSKYKPLQDKLIKSQEKSREIMMKKGKLGVDFTILQIIASLHLEPESQVKFPFELLDELRKTDKESDYDVSKPRFKSGELDTEYEEFLKHHNFIQELALKRDYKFFRPIDYEEEIEAWADQSWRRNYGSADPTVPASKVPCQGCGAYLHCTDHAIPGYLPSELFKSKSNNELKKTICQRCDFLKTHNVCLDATVLPTEYPKVISQIQHSPALVILLVDLTDFPASIHPKIFDYIGHKRKIILVGNKVDLLPKDSVGYLDRVEESLKKAVLEIGCKNLRIRRTCLISAKTGYNVETLVTMLMEESIDRDIYLVSSTNAGKSTLFNSLLQTDLCRAREKDLIQRATTSLWPGTTMNLLKFPIGKIRGWEMKLRQDRMAYFQRQRLKEDGIKKLLYRQTKNQALALLSDRVGSKPTPPPPFALESSHPMAKQLEISTPFAPDAYANQGYHFFHDTPGSVYKEQILTLLTTEELLKTIPRDRIIPRTFSLWPAQTLFLAGLGRIDVVHARSNVQLTVFASHYLPIHVVFTDQAQQFYNTFLGSSMLQVPVGDSKRLEKWPILLPKEFDFIGINWGHSCADIVLSSAGWVSVTMSPLSDAVLKAWTPEGRGIFSREPSMLPYAVKLKGRKIYGTPCFTADRSTIDEIGDDSKILEYNKNKVELPPYRSPSRNQTSSEHFKERYYSY